MEPTANPTQPQQPAPEQPQQPQPQPQPPQPQPTPAVDPEIAQMRTRLAELETAEAKRQADAREAQAADLVQKGRAEEVAKHYQERLDGESKRFNDLMDRTRGAEKARTITAELSGHQLAYPEASADLLTLWANDFETIDTPDGGFSVREKTSLRPASEVVKERLASPRWSSYVAATSRGGGGTVAPGALPTGQSEAPAANLGEHIARQWNGRTQPRGMVGLHGKPSQN